MRMRHGVPEIEMNNDCFCESRLVKQKDTD